MTRKAKRNFSPEFRLEAAQLVVDHNYSVLEAAEAMIVSHSAMDKWGRQLRQERNGSGLSRWCTTTRSNLWRTISGQVKGAAAWYQNRIG